VDSFAVEVGRAVLQCTWYSASAVRRCASPRISARSRSSRRRVPTSRSRCARSWSRRPGRRQRWREVRFAVADQELNASNRSPKPRARLRACCTVHSPVGLAVTPPMCIRRLPCSMNTRTYNLLRNTVSTCRKSTATIPAAWACRISPPIALDDKQQENEAAFKQEMAKVRRTWKSLGFKSFGKDILVMDPAMVYHDETVKKLARKLGVPQ
jgi:hypothetical protein